MKVYIVRFEESTESDLNFYLNIKVLNLFFFFLI